MGQSPPGQAAACRSAARSETQPVMATTAERKFPAEVVMSGVNQEWSGPAIRTQVATAALVASGKARTLTPDIAASFLIV